MKMSKYKWNWIKFIGKHFLIKFLNKADQEYILYHRRFFEVKSWDKFFKEDFK